MNIKTERGDAETVKSLQLHDAFSRESSLAQSDLGQRPEMALGLFDSYIKNPVAKGYVTGKRIFEGISHPPMRSAR